MAANPYISNILFLDIETVSQYSNLEMLPDDWQQLWNKKAESLLRYHENETASGLYGRAAIYAEFGKVICISCGCVQQNGNERKLVLKSFSGHNEKEVLAAFSNMLTRWASDGNKMLCAHNGKEFDFPYLCRRFVINQLPIPALLNNSGKKPWEVNHLDTMELWKFGDFKNYTSLSLLAHSLGIPTPKDDIDGSMVGEVYWKENNLERIVTYCQKDVVTVVQIYLRLIAEPLIDIANIEIK